MWLSALDFELTPPQEIGIAGEGAQPLLEVVFEGYRPSQVVAWKEAGAASVIPLLEGRETREGRATAYVCQNFACQMPVTEAGLLAEQLN